MVFLFSFLSLFITFILIKLILPFLKKNLIDIPNSRSLHFYPTPKGGGIIFAFVSSFFLFLLKNYIGLISIPLSIVGLIDDKLNLSKQLRYFSQFLSVFIIFLLSNMYPIMINDQKNIIQLLIFIVVLIIGTAIINFTNFMDGIDGLVAGCMIVWFTTISLCSNQSYFILVASLLGFLIWNWAPSKIFMGDAGSTYLGLIVVGTLLNMKSITFMFNSLLILSPLYIDAISCIIRRILKKQNIFSAHNLHLYQRLNKKGISKSKISLIYISNINSLILF